MAPPHPGGFRDCPSPHFARGDAEFARVEGELDSTHRPGYSDAVQRERPSRPGGCCLAGRTSVRLWRDSPPELVRHSNVWLLNSDRNDVATGMGVLQWV
jgi:hypothetical protein